MDKERKHIGQLKNGSYKAFTHLYESYALRLHSFVLKLTHSEELTKDIVQETFIKVWERRGLIDLDMSFKSFIFTIAKNHLLNELRKEVNRHISLEEALSDETADSSEEEREHELSIIEFNRNLEAAKAKLTPRQRELFELNKEQGISVADIAVTASISEQSVRNQISQAVGILRKELGKYKLLFSIFFI